MNPEQQARETIDNLLEKAGWVVCNASEANITASLGVAIREFPLQPGHGFADYLLYLNGKAIGIIEAKKAGTTLKAITNLEKSLRENRPRALIQMATGSGKTFTAISAIYRIKTQITEGGSKVEAGYCVEQQDLDKSAGKPIWTHVVRPKGAGTWRCQPQTREKRWQELDEDLENQAKQLDRDVVTPDQIRTVVTTFRDKLFTEIYPGRTEVPKTLFFAKGEAETGEHPVNVRPAERVCHGRRTLGFRAERDARAKKHNHAENIVDAVGVCEQDKTDSKPMEKKPAVSFEKLLQAVSFGSTDEAVLTSIAGRLARMEHRLTEDDDRKIRQLAQGLGVKDLSHQLVEAVNPDKIVEAASRRLQQIESTHNELGYLNPYAPIEIHHANLPHWRQDGAIYFVTFRLVDALPQAKLVQWREEKQNWLSAHPKPWNEEEAKEHYLRFGKTLEKWLDRGLGSCVLEIPEVCDLVARAIAFFEGDRYRLGKFVVAANHVHVIVQPLPGYQLSSILHSWKSYTAKQIIKVEAASRRLTENKRQDAASTVWQKEYYDRVVRTPEELYNIEQYIERHGEYDRGAWEKRRPAA